MRQGRRLTRRLAHEAGRAGADPPWHRVISAYTRQIAQSVAEVAVQDGFDVVLAGALDRVCRGERPQFHAAQALPSLSVGDRLSLLAGVFERCRPIRSVTYPMRGSVAADSEVVALGISVASLQRLGANHPPLSQVFGYEEAILRRRSLEIVSPLSGAPLTSTTSLLQLSGQGRAAVIFHFVEDGEPFFLFTARLNGSFSGLFFPQRDLQVSAPPETPGMLATFRALMIECAAQTADHIRHEGRRPLALLTGVTHHFGHSIFNEYQAYHRCAEEGWFQGVDAILRGSANYTQHDKVFPELEGVPVTDVDDVVAAFRLVVERRYLVVRPTCNYWVSTGLGERLRAAARRDDDEHPSAELAAARSRWPLLWIEIRSHDRRWIDQERQLPRLIDALARDYPRLGVIMAGWSRLVDEHEADAEMIESDASIVRRVAAAVASGVPVFDTTGVSVLEKLGWADAADVFVATYGTGLILPCFAGRSPGVIHTNTGYLQAVTQQRARMLFLFGDTTAELRLIAAEHILDELPERPYAIASHCLDWRPVYDELLAILAGLAARS